ncbi:hypothetical protein [Kitasatospora cineracea]|uniref:Uncharacterized protein n=1 Tax=Kitasatospora cineracea TaxID=88074 RepID=A0A8G1XCP6_9ACTN|nr:hypothetical protein [Kitasatospora cineracea]ROR43401.1 hypothetical protein EDD39_1555 [Kitasatospora cineracea]
MKCTFCGQAKPDVMARTDPFDLEINGTVWIVPMCDDCEQIRCDDI